MAGSTYKATISLPQTPFPMKANLPATEPSWLERWERQDLYARIRAARHGKPVFLLHDGPPYANGALHLGTALNKVIKDFIVKSKSMSGFDAPYVPGWDCHGLPIEIKVDQELGPGKATMPVLEIRRRCEEYARKYVDVQRAGFKRLGVFGQWDEPYLTLNRSYEAAIAAQLLHFIAHGYAYKGLRAVYWCIHDRTALAEAEVEYKNHTSPSVWMRYAYESGALPGGLKGVPVYAVVWTTTPWTLPAIEALAWHPEMEYVAVRTHGGEVYLMASSRLAAAAAAGAGWSEAEVIARFPGQAMEDVTFRHPWLARSLRSVMADYVTMDQGSGIVHTAPGHGAEDFATGEKYHLPILCPVDAEGKFFGPESAPFEGQQVFAANPAIIAHLRRLGALLAEAPLQHSYPHCWRCHHPIIFRATEQWFIGMDRGELRRRALEAIGTVRWLPSWGEERIRQMVAGRPDWCISRQRVWGVPIPVLVCAQCHQYLRDDATDRRIVQAFAERGSNAWFSEPPEAFLAPGVKCAGCGHTRFVQERDIVDVWFESGCSQAAVLNDATGLPFPADVYIEGGDQYRGWFQSSLLVAVGTRGRAPYRQALTHGWVVDAEGRSMHKSLGNTIEPDAIVADYGAEILRLWAAGSDYREEVTLSPELLQRLAEAYRKVRNTFRYLLGNLHDFRPGRETMATAELMDLDRRMLRQAARAALETEREYTEYAFHRAYRRLADFCTVELSAFYLDVLKDRLYTSAPQGPARRSGQTVLWRMLDALVRLFAPLLPFTSEEVWEAMGAAGLREGSASVHEQVYADVRAWFPHGLEAPDEDARWQRLMFWREAALQSLERARQEKRIGTSLEARLELRAAPPDAGLLEAAAEQLPALFIVSQVRVMPAPPGAPPEVRVLAAAGSKCERCWNYSEAVGADASHPTLCDRCTRALAEMGAAAAR